MATLQELQDQVVSLQEAVDQEQQQVANLLASNQATVAALEAQVAELQALVDAAPTPEQIQARRERVRARRRNLTPVEKEKINAHRREEIQ